MTVRIGEVERIAALARIRLSAEEARAMSVQLSSILDHMAALRRVDLRAPPAEGGVGEGVAPLREDVVRFDPLLRPPAALAPAWEEPFFVVPRLPSLGGPAPPGEEG